ncbi:MAG: formyltransferase family protein [Nitratireductor sp.]
MSKRVIAFSSGGPGNFRSTLEFSLAHQDIKLVHLITDRPGIPSLDLAAQYGIASCVEPIVGRLNMSDPASVFRRIQALDRIYSRLCDIESAGGLIDLIVLAFRKVLLGPIIDRFGPRMINVHPSDLSVHNVSDRRRRYTGLNGLKKAITDGNATTRTTIHRVDSGIDTGALLCLGPSVPFAGNRASDADIDRHEQLQKEQSDAVALNHALHCWFYGDPRCCSIL